MRTALLALSLAACTGGKIAIDDTSGTDSGATDDSAATDDTADTNATDDTGTDDTSETGDSGATDWPELFINEFMASNRSTLEDEDGSFPDWLELYNASDAAVDLSGYTMSNDLEEIDKHTFAALSIDAGGFLLLYADADVDQGDTHLSFNLPKAGGQIGLYAPDGTSLNRLEYAEQAEDLSAARVPDGTSTWEITSSPTPGDSNGT